MTTATNVSRSSTVKQGSKTTARSQKPEPNSPKNTSKTQRTAAQTGASQRLNTMFNDPAQMEQWVASSAVPFGSSPPDASFGFPQMPIKIGAHGVSALSSGDYAPTLPTAGLRSTVSAPQRIVNGSNVTTTVSASQYTAGYNATHFPDLAGSDSILGEQNQASTWAYPSPQDDGFSYSFQDHVDFSQVSDWDPTSSMPCDWSGAPYSGITSTSGAELQPGSDQSTWTPTSIVDSSVSSSCSQASLVAGLPQTPISPYLMDHHGATDLSFSIDAENGQFQALNLEEPVQNVSPAAYFKEPFDAESTLRPCRPLQRTPLTNMATWAPSQIPTQAMTNPNGLVDNSRPLGSGESSNAREHQYYSIGPKDDGLYHCPFGIDGDCQHKPEKLKCNYDKHLDSHLKPYRCKISTCSESQFSSTACLLRHEREAHGMHGHGEKPHLCYFSECDRSIAGNGFPRRWNLFDHMKRVHDYTGSSSSSHSGGGSPPSSGSSRSERRQSQQGHNMTARQQQQQQQLPIRNSIANGNSGNNKRRQASSPTQAAEPMKRSRSNQMAPSSSGTKPSSSMVMKPTKSYSGCGPSATGHLPAGYKHRQSLQKSFEQQKAALQAQVDSLQPYDAQGFREMTAHYQVLNTVAMDLQRQGAGEAAGRARGY